MIRVEDRERLTRERGVEIAAKNGYTDYCMFADGRDAAIVRFAFTHAIIADLTEWGHGERWCYTSYCDAKRALDAWDGAGEPNGWFRHPDTARRRPDGDPSREYFDP